MFVFGGTGPCKKVDNQQNATLEVINNMRQNLNLVGNHLVLNNNNNNNDDDDDDDEDGDDSDDTLFDENIEDIFNDEANLDENGGLSDDALSDDGLSDNDGLNDFDRKLETMQDLHILNLNSK